MIFHTLGRNIMMRKYFLLFVLFLFSCSKEQEENMNAAMEPTTITENLPETFNYVSESSRTLNVVYFTPKDMKTRDESHRRISEILLHGQQFFKEQMRSYGFGEKTFSLIVDQEKKRVKIIYIEGELNASSYTYDSGAQPIIEQLKAYFESHPEDSKSHHTLIILPVDDPYDSDAPYYGIGRWAFATDYNEMEIKYLGGDPSAYSTKKATTYIGGLVHELGHALNLPHNKQKRSEFGLENKGTTLMGSGNYTYGTEPTFLSEASCAILNNNEIFNTNSAAYYSGGSASIESLNAEIIEGEMVLSGNFTTDLPVNSISIYHDPADDTADYDAISWRAAVTEDNTFFIRMSLDELEKKGDTPYVLRLRLNHLNGNSSTFSYAYSFENGEPILDISFSPKTYFDNSKWRIFSFSSEETGGGEPFGNGLANLIIDGKDTTYWHSCWTTCNVTHPHELVVDTQGSTEVKGFSFLQRNGSRKIKDIEILVSEDASTWESLEDFVLSNINTPQNLDFVEQKSFRYFKIRINSAHDGEQFASLAEVRIY